MIWLDRVEVLNTGGSGNLSIFTIKLVYFIFDLPWPPGSTNKGDTVGSYAKISGTKDANANTDNSHWDPWKISRFHLSHFFSNATADTDHQQTSFFLPPWWMPPEPRV
jgi:hypothetical protein